MMYRYEEKYLINEKQYIILKSRLKVILKPDINSTDNNEYLIRSIYFDDNTMTSLKQKEYGIKNRFKYRIRFYNNNYDYIKLEKKVKHNNVGYKQSLILSKQETNSLLNEDFSFLENKKELIANELLFLKKTKQLHPVIIIDYHREAYLSSFNDIRITFDKDVSYSTNVKDALTKELSLTKAIDKIILEVKFNNFLPKYIKQLLTENIYKTSISKYLLCHYHSKGEELL